MQPFSGGTGLEPMAHQSLAGYIRQHLSEIETDICNGKSQAEIAKAINSAGYPTLNVRAFTNYLARARKQVRTQKSPSPVIADIPAAEAAEKNPLKKPAGFEWNGTMKDNDLF